MKNTHLKVIMVPSKTLLFLLVISVTVVAGDVREIVTSDWVRGSLPEEIRLRVPGGDLKLRRESQRVAYVEVAEKGRLGVWKGQKDELFGVYSDDLSEASFSVAVTSRVTVYGSFKIQGELFSIRPTPPHFRPHHRVSSFYTTSLLKKITICGIPHLLERHPPINPPIYSPIQPPIYQPIYSFNNSSTIPPVIMYNDIVKDRLKATQGGSGEQGTSSQFYIMSEQQFKLLQHTHPSKNTQQHTKNTQHLTVELYVVVDYSIYRQWLELHRTSDRAITDLRYYYAHIVNGMSKRYEKMRLPGVKVTVSIAGYYIAKSRKDAPFTDSSKNRINSTTIDVYKTLDMFFEWIRDKVREQPPSLPRFDAAMLFTRQTLGVRNNETKHIRTISGLADIGALCQVNSVSIVKDFGLHGTLDTATHELAHNLGANHDGSDNDCLSGDQYIMALAPNPVANRIYNNTLSFSNCSKTDFSKYIDKLNKNERNCMLDGWSSAEKDNVSSLLQHHPGQNYSLDQQCKLTFGRESYFCGGGGSRIRELCMGMFCYRPSTRGCKTEVQLKAADGTLCDNKSWCQGGHCVPDDDAPEFDNTCPYGDFKDKVPLVESGHIECRQIRQKENSLCYNSFYSNLCCASCAKLKTNKEGCEYGDRNITKCPRIKPFRCYNDDLRKECCRSCELKKPKKPLPNCEYGDRAEWCSNSTIFSPLNCYNQQDRNVCCATCHKFLKGREGCEYGNRGTGCNIEDCVKKSYWLYCCETCSSLINNVVFKEMIAAQLSAQRATPAPFQVQDNFVEDLKCTKDQASWCGTLKAHQCYSAHPTCCATCLTFQQADKKGCEYGDKSTECKVANCVGENYIETCCFTCSSLFKYRPTTTSLATIPPTKPPTKPPPRNAATTKPNIKPNIKETHRIDTQKTTMTKSIKGSNIKNPTTTQTINDNSITPNQQEPHTKITHVYPIECPKGDRAKWCRRIKASQCYKSNQTCCHSCAQFYDPSIQGCEYGDKALWCENHVVRQAKDCSSSSSAVPTTCCRSCLNHKTEPEKAPESFEGRESKGIEWLCAAGDQASYCSAITKAHACYSYKGICCATCTRFIDRTVPNCQFGDRVNWCGRYRGDEKSCGRRDISMQCCKTCAPYVYHGRVPKSSLCTNQASWCSNIKASQCYHHEARSTCCASCHHLAQGNEGECRYGDRVSWCEEQFCKSNPTECCQTCAELAKVP